MDIISKLKKILLGHTVGSRQDWISLEFILPTLLLFRPLKANLKHVNGEDRQQRKFFKWSCEKAQAKSLPMVKTIRISLIPQDIFFKGYPTILQMSSNKILLKSLMRPNFLKIKLKMKPFSEILKNNDIWPKKKSTFENKINIKNR